jgi:transposase-like protein
VDREGRAVDFLPTPDSDQEAAEAFLRKAIPAQLLKKITIDQSGTNTAAIKHYNRTHKTGSAIQVMLVNKRCSVTC